MVTRPAPETCLGETPRSLAASSWVIIRKFAEFSSGLLGLPCVEYWHMR